MVKKQGKKVKQQASLFTFFGKNKNKKRSLDDNCKNDETVHDKPAYKHIKLSSADNDNDTVVNNESCNDTEVLEVSSHDVANDDNEKVDKKEGAPSQLSLERNNTPQKVDELVEKPKSNNPAIESSSDTSDTDTDNSGDDSEEEEESTNNLSSNNNVISEQGAPPDDEDNNKYKGKSPYEILREKNIERNNARLAALGLLVGVQQQSDTKKKKRKKASAKKATTASSIPTRRSGRKKPVVTNSGTALEVQHDDNLVSTSNSNEKMSKELEEQQEEEEELFTVSPLIEYQMTSSTPNESTSDSIETKEGTISSSISTLTPTGPRLNPPSGLNAIYSLQFHPPSWESNVNNQNGSSSSSSSWLAGAGKSGLIALWDCSKHNNKNLVQDEEEGESYINPLISWKGHSGRWIADARFVPPPSSSISSNSTSSSTVPSRLLTAGNDGNVCHWDLTLTSSTGVPKLLEQSTKLLHGSGIFSMDVSIPSSSSSSPYIVTGSKDKSITVTSLDQLSNDPIWRSNYHSAKVGCVSFSSSNNNPLIASASDDGCVAIHDARLNGTKGSTSSNGTVAVLEDAHVKPHSAVWQPGSDCIFMTGEYILYVYKFVPLEYILHILYSHFIFLIYHINSWIRRGYQAMGSTEHFLARGILSWTCAWKW